MQQIALTRNKLWYNQYDKMIAFDFAFASALRYKFQRIDEFLRYQRYKNITATQKQNLYDLRDFFASVAEPHSLFLTRNRIYLYTTSQTLIDLLTDLPCIDHTFTQVKTINLVGDENTLVRKYPKHKFRVYFRDVKLTEPEIHNIVSYLSNQQDVKMSPSLRRWVHRLQWPWIGGWFFFDCNDTKIPTMLMLINPKLIRKTVPIISDK